MMLEIDKARALLEQALQLAESGSASPELQARTALGLAIVTVNGLQDNAEGMSLCRRALALDPTIQPDPLASTPEFLAVFKLAGGTVKKVATPSESKSKSAAPGTFAGPGNMPHTPVAEQLASTAVPVFLEVPAHAKLGAVFVYYQGLGMDRYEELPMKRIEGGYAAEIPCADVFEPAVKYYLVANDPKGNPLGFTGTPKQPVVVPIVSARTYPAPAVPGWDAPAPCSMDECPPGEPRCNIAEEAGMCSVDDECGKGERCVEGACKAAAKKTKGLAIGDSDGPPRLVLQLAGAFGAAYVKEGMPADRIPAEGHTPTDYPYAVGGSENCNLDPNRWCVRVSQPGFIPIYSLRFALGYYFIPRLGVSVFGRLQLSPTGRSQTGFPPSLMIGGRIHVRATKPRATGFEATPYVGFSYGELQVRPEQGPGAPERPFIISGLNGMQFGAQLTYRPWRNAGFFFSPEIMLQFPAFMFAVEPTIGVEVGF